MTFAPGFSMTFRTLNISISEPKATAENIEISASFDGMPIREITPQKPPKTRHQKNGIGLYRSLYLSSPPRLTAGGPLFKMEIAGRPFSRCL